MKTEKTGGLPERNSGTENAENSENTVNPEILKNSASESGEDSVPVKVEKNADNNNNNIGESEEKSEEKAGGKTDVISEANENSEMPDPEESSEESSGVSSGVSSEESYKESSEKNDISEFDISKSDKNTEVLDKIEREKAKTASKKKNKKLGKVVKSVIVSVSAVIVLAAIVYSVYVNSYDSVMPNTYVENINLGGMSQTDAGASLTKEYDGDKLIGKTMNFYCMDAASTISIENLSMSFEPEKMASDAFAAGREETGFLNKLVYFTKSLFTKNTIDISITYDEQALTGAIEDLCSPYETEPLGYTFRLGDNNDIIIAKPQQGVKVNMENAVKQVVDEICTFNFGDVTFNPEITDAEPLDLDAFYNYITAPAIDASYAKDENNKVYVVPSKPQIVVNKSDIENAINRPEEEYSVPVQIVKPAVDEEFLQSILYEDTLGTYTTDYSSSSASRANNIRVASGTISGIELLPGEKFDFNGVVGERTSARGYLQAPVYVVKNGKTESEMDYGGGICQVSSTIYCAVYRAGLDVVERTSHSKEVTYVPEGMDATVSWGGPEFIFKNSTDYPIRVLIDTSGGLLTVRIVGSSVSKPNVSLDVQNDGSSVVVTKTTTSSDGSVISEVISSLNPPTPSPTEEVSVSDTEAENEAADGETDTSEANSSEEDASVANSE